MIPLRDKVPTRRTKPTKNPSGENWSHHKPDLKEDFNNRCAYCDSFDGFRHTYFEVDHFIPKDFFKQFGNIDSCQYNNLVYSCKFCNNSKRAKWPTQSQTEHNNGKQGFVDPCSKEYDAHFYRTNEGAIMWKNELGKWMHSVAFKFDEREKSIIILWNMDKLKKIIDEIASLLKKYKEDSFEYKLIYTELGKFTTPYYFLHQELIDFYNE